MNEIDIQREAIAREREALDRREEELRAEFCGKLRIITAERQRLRTEEAILLSLERKAVPA